MAAIASPSVVVPAGTSLPRARPPTGRTIRARRSAATFRRRRLGALAGFVALAPAAQLCAALLGGGPLTAPEGPQRDVAAHVYVVQPGDTLWSIAARLRPGADPRPLVQALTAELGGAGLQPGEALQLP